MPSLFAFADAPSAHVSAHVLLTGIQSGPLDLLADGIEVMAVALYLLGVRRLARRGRHWSRWSAAAFLGGVAVVWIAIGSGLAAYDEINVTMHVIQHVLLMMIAPPLIALGKPVTLASQAASRRRQVRILKLVHSPVVAVLTFPIVAWIVYYVTMYAYFMTGLYPYSIAHPLFHDATHLWFFGVGLLYWQPIVGLDPTRWRMSYPVRIGSLFLGMPFEAFLGIGITELPKPISPINTLANTHTAGDTFWILAMIVTGLCLGTVVLQWFRQLDRETVQEDRRVQATSAENRARAGAVGCSSASRSRSHSPAWVVVKTLPGATTTAGTPRALRASRTRLACRLVRTSTARWPGCTGWRRAVLSVAGASLDAGSSTVGSGADPAGAMCGAGGVPGSRSAAPAVATDGVDFWFSSPGKCMSPRWHKLCVKCAYPMVFHPRSRTPGQVKRARSLY